MGAGRRSTSGAAGSTDLAAVTVTVDGGRFEVGTVLAEWDSGGEVSFYDARVLGGGASLGLASAEFLQNLRNRSRLDIGVYLGADAESVVESVSLRGSNSTISRLSCVG